MRTTPTDLLEVHANILPMSLLLQNACHRATVHIATHPSSHPLHDPIRRAANRYVGSHRSSLHILTRQFAIIPRDIESLNPAHKPPQHSNIHRVRIANSKQKAIEEHIRLTDTIQIYSDGSGHEGKIGAAAVLFRAGQQPRTLCYHLGTDKEHTVFEAEAVGLNLAAKLLAMEIDPIFPVSILVNNQAAIQSGKNFHPCPGSYLTDLFCNRLTDIKKDHLNFKVTVRWIPGHSEVHSNEEADKHAKRRRKAAITTAP
jgi:ribonuclease HI